MAIQVIIQVAAKGAQVVGQTTARAGAVAGRLTARGAQKGAQAAARAGAKAGQGAARTGARAGQKAGQAGKNVRNHTKSPHNPRRPGTRPDVRGHNKGARDPRRPGQGPKPRDHNGPKRNPRRPGEKAQSQGTQPPKEPLKSNAKGIGKVAEKVQPRLKARAQRRLKARGRKELRDLLRGDDRKDDKPKSAFQGDGYEKAILRGTAKAVKGGVKLIRRRIRRMFISAEGDKLLQRTKKVRRLVFVMAGTSFMLILLLPLILGIIVAVMLSNDEAGLAATVVANQPIAATGGIPPAMLDEVAAATGIPLDALTAYSKASANPDWSIDWTILAGIGKAECDHGRSTELYCTTPYNVWTTGSGGAGERGPMQHLGDLWRAGIPGTETEQKNTLRVEGEPTPKGQDQGGTYIATDGSGDGLADPWNWEDAVLSAARKLTLYRKQLKAKGAAYDTDEFMIAAYNAGVGGATENGAKPSNIKNRSYITKVEAESKRIKTAVEPLDLPAYNMANVVCPGGGAGPAGASALVLGSTEAMTDAMSTATNMAVANAAIACFGRGKGVGCYSPRAGDLYEHPRGRACDYMRSTGGVMPDAVQQANGTAMAEWAVANAKNLNILYVIWYGRIWSVGRDDKPLPWSQWRGYEGDGVTGGHYDHVHISVKLMPGDPPHAHCSHSSCTE